MNCIAYITETGARAVIYPANTVAKAMKDVPPGKPYKIVEVTDIPSNRSTRNTWIVDEADLTDGVGA